MKTLKKLPFLLSVTFTLALVSLSGCYISLDDDDFHCVRGRGALKTETYNLSEFSSISNSISAAIFITTGSANHRVVVSARGNVLDDLNVRTRGGELIIGSDRCVENGDVEIDIFMAELEGLFNSGSASISGTNTWETNHLVLNLSGSGKIDAQLDVNSADASIAGSGDLELSGTVREVDLSIAGSGNMEAFGLETATCDINIAGSGNAEIFASEELTGTISGSGTIRYKGSPSVKVNITGSGRVVDNN